jgi:hypothetical protein
MELVVADALRDEIGGLRSDCREPEGSVDELTVDLRPKGVSFLRARDLEGDRAVDLAVDGVIAEAVVLSTKESVASSGCSCSWAANRVAISVRRFAGSASRSSIQSARPPSIAVTAFCGSTPSFHTIASG